MRRNTVAIAAWVGLLAVTASAFGAHALADHVTPERLETFRLAGRYQLLHAVLLVALGLAGDRLERRTADLAVVFLFAGVLVFCGSLYVLVLADQAFWGAVTPIGGLLLHAGWFCVFLAAWRAKR